MPRRLYAIMLQRAQRSRCSLGHFSASALLAAVRITTVVWASHGLFVACARARAAIVVRTLFSGFGAWVRTLSTICKITIQACREDWVRGAKHSDRTYLVDDDNQH